MEQKNNRRSSILKKSDDTTVDITTKLKRRISFSGKKSVKEFVAGDEEATIWGTSYEESAELNVPGPNIGSIHEKRIVLRNRKIVVCQKNENPKQFNTTESDKKKLPVISAEESKTAPNSVEKSNETIKHCNLETINTFLSPSSTSHSLLANSGDILNYSDSSKSVNMEQTIDITLYDNEKPKTDCDKPPESSINKNSTISLMETSPDIYSRSIQLSKEEKQKIRQNREKKIQHQKVSNIKNLMENKVGKFCGGLRMPTQINNLSKAENNKRKTTVLNSSGNEVYTTDYIATNQEIRPPARKVHKANEDSSIYKKQNIFTNQIKNSGSTLFKLSDNKNVKDLQQEKFFVAENSKQNDMDVYVTDYKSRVNQPANCNPIINIGFNETSKKESSRSVTVFQSPGLEIKVTDRNVDLNIHSKNKPNCKEKTEQSVDKERPQNNKRVTLFELCDLDLTGNHVNTDFHSLSIEKLGHNTDVGKIPIRTKFAEKSKLCNKRETVFESADLDITAADDNSKFHESPIEVPTNNGKYEKVMISAHKPSMKENKKRETVFVSCDLDITTTGENIVNSLNKVSIDNAKVEKASIIGSHQLSPKRNKKRETVLEHCNLDVTTTNQNIESNEYPHEEPNNNADVRKLTDVNTHKPSTSKNKNRETIFESCDLDITATDDNSKFHESPIEVSANNGKYEKVMISTHKPSMKDNNKRETVFVSCDLDTTGENIVNSLNKVSIYNAKLGKASKIGSHQLSPKRNKKRETVFEHCNLDVTTTNQNIEFNEYPHEEPNNNADVRKLTYVNAHKPSKSKNKNRETIFESCDLDITATDEIIEFHDSPQEVPVSNAKYEKFVMISTHKPSITGKNKRETVFGSCDLDVSPPNQIIKFDEYLHEGYTNNAKVRELPDINAHKPSSRGINKRETLFESCDLDITATDNNIEFHKSPNENPTNDAKYEKVPTRSSHKPSIKENNNRETVFGSCDLDITATDENIEFEVTNTNAIYENVPIGSSHKPNIKENDKRATVFGSCDLDVTGKNQNFELDECRYEGLINNAKVRKPYNKSTHKPTTRVNNKRETVFESCDLDLTASDEHIELHKSPNKVSNNNVKYEKATNQNIDFDENLHEGPNNDAKVRKLPNISTYKASTDGNKKRETVFECCDLDITATDKNIEFYESRNEVTSTNAIDEKVPTRSSHKPSIKENNNRETVFGSCDLDITGANYNFDFNKYSKGKNTSKLKLHPTKENNKRATVFDSCDLDITATDQNIESNNYCNVISNIDGKEKKMTERSTQTSSKQNYKPETISSQTKYKTNLKQDITFSESWDLDISTIDPNIKLENSINTVVENNECKRSGKIPFKRLQNALFNSFTLDMSSTEVNNILFEQTKPVNTRNAKSENVVDNGQKNNWKPNRSSIIKDVDMDLDNCVFANDGSNSIHSFQDSQPFAKTINPSHTKEREAFDKFSNSSSDINKPSVNFTKGNLSNTENKSFETNLINPCIPLASTVKKDSIYQLILTDEDNNSNRTNSVICLHTNSKLGQQTLTKTFDLSGIAKIDEESIGLVLNKTDMETEKSFNVNENKSVHIPTNKNDIDMEVDVDLESSVTNDSNIMMLKPKQHSSSSLRQTMYNNIEMDETITNQYITHPAKSTIHKYLNTNINQSYDTIEIPRRAIRKKKMVFEDVNTNLMEAKLENEKSLYFVDSIFGNVTCQSDIELKGGNVIDISMQLNKNHKDGESIIFSNISKIIPQEVELSQHINETFLPNTTGAICNFDVNNIQSSFENSPIPGNNNTAYGLANFSKLVSSPYDIIEKTHLSLVDSTISEDSKLICDKHLSEIAKDNLIENHNNTLPINVNDIPEKYIAEISVCAKCQCRRSKSSNDTTIQNYNFSPLPLLEADFTRLDKYKGKPLIKDVLIKWKEKLETVNFDLSELTIKEPIQYPKIPDFEFLLENKKIEQLEYYRSIIVYGAKFPADVKFPDLVINKINSENSNWRLREVLAKLSNTLFFSHKRVKTLAVLIKFSSSPSGCDVLFDSVEIRTNSAILQITWTPIDHVMYNQCLLELSPKYNYMCTCSSKLFAFLDQVNNICIKTLKLTRSFELAVFKAGGKLIRFNNDTYIQKIIRSISADYKIETKECKILVKDINTIDHKNLFPASVEFCSPKIPSFGRVTL